MGGLSFSEGGEGGGGGHAEGFICNTVLCMNAHLKRMGAILIRCQEQLNKAEAR